MTPDVRRILWAQALRALAYGFASVLLGATLAGRGWSTTKVGLLLSFVLAGTVLATAAVGAWADRLGRRRCYVVLFGALALAGLALGLTDAFWVLAAVALTGALSTEVVESGPFTSLEQAMLSEDLDGSARVRAFGVYNAVAALAGSLGALAAGGPALVREVVPGLPSNQHFFLILTAIGIAGVAVAASLSPAVEAPLLEAETSRVPLRRSRRQVLGLSGLFAVDSFGGGFVIQSFIAFYLARRFGASLEVLGVVFFLLGLLQSASFLVATRLAERFGLLRTMVFTHLPSNLLLASVAFAPTFALAVALLFARQALSQMDVPTRQAYVMALVAPEERTAAAATTNTARYLVRPVGPALAGVAQQVALGLPFLVAGGIKAVYDLALWRWFRHVPLPEEAAQTAAREPVSNFAGVAPGGEGSP
ncbi:MAG: MFS transporter [Actinobacteria bacterium]|nr:MFS transporter [Actinomycetota bacterium]